MRAVVVVVAILVAAAGVALIAVEIGHSGATTALPKSSTTSSTVALTTTTDTVPPTTTTVPPTTTTIDPCANRTRPPTDVHSAHLLLSHGRNSKTRRHKRRLPRRLNRHTNGA